MLTARADHVGSLLRPPELLEARRALAAHELDAAAFKAIEDRAVLDALRQPLGPEAVGGRLSDLRRLHGRRRRDPRRRGPRARPPRRDVPPARRAPLPAAHRPDVARVLRGARLAARPLA